MKMHRLFATLSKLTVVAMAITFLTGAVGAQAATLSNQILIHNQDINTGLVVVDSVTATQNGWVVLYKNPNLDSNERVGQAWIHQGSNMGVKVIVNMPLISKSPVLWAVLQADAGVAGLFEWGNHDRAFADGPIVQGKQVVVTAFATSATPSPAALLMLTNNTASKATITDHITFRNQDIKSGVILVDSVTTDQDGWVVIYRNPNFTAGEIVGYAPVYRGTNTNIKVTIDTAKVGDLPTLWVQLHMDSGRQNVFEWGQQGDLLSDWPIVQNGKYIRTSFGTTALAGTGSNPATTTNSVTIHNQSLNTGIITVDSVSMAQNGWVVIYKNSNFTAGEIVGYAPVYQGTNMGVRVTVDTVKVGDRPTLWAVLQVDNGFQNIFEWGYRGRQFSDPPIWQQKGGYVAAAFGTSGP